MCYPLLINRKFSSLLFVVGGVLFNIGLLLLFTKSGLEEALSGLTPNPDGAVFLGMILPLAVLIPQKVTLYGRKLSSDSLHFIELLEIRNGEKTQVGEFFYNQIKKYSNEVCAENLKSLSAPKILYLLYRLTTDTQKEDWGVSEMELGKLVASGTLPPLEEALILDFLIGYAAMSGDDLLLGKAQKWLTRVLSIAPDALTLKLTRGSLFAATGQYREAKELLLPFTSDTSDQGDRLGAYLFLAYSDCHLNNRDAAVRWLLEARRIMDTVTPSGFFKQRYSALEAKILTHERLPEIP